MGGDDDEAQFADTTLSGINWYLHTEENDAALRPIVRAWCDDGKGRLSQLAGIAGYAKGPSELSRWLSRELPVLPDVRYYPIVEFGLANGWFAGNDAVLQHGLASFLGISPGPWTKKHPAIAGHFIVHRYSFLARDHVLVGYLYIHPATLRTREVFRIQKGVGGRTADAWYPRAGVVLPRGNGSFVAVSKKTDQHAELQLTYLKPTGHPVTQLHGQIADWHGDHFYGARFVADRIEGELPDSDIIAVPRETVTGSILEYLEDIHIEGHVARLT